MERFRSLNARDLGIPNFGRFLGARVYPPGKRTVRAFFLDATGKRVFRSFYLWLPYSLFVLCKDRYGQTGMFAFLSNSDISGPNTLVFPFALPNVSYSTGEACLGRTCPKSIGKAISAFWETSFDCTEFWDGLTMMDRFLPVSVPNDSELAIDSNFYILSAWRDQYDMQKVFADVETQESRSLLERMERVASQSMFLFPAFL